MDAKSGDSDKCVHLHALAQSLNPSSQCNPGALCTIKMVATGWGNA